MFSHGPEMPRYKSHKTVRALEIKAVVPDHGRTRVDFVEEGHLSHILEPAMMARYTPVAGDYYVVYDDGYHSLSPRKAFLDGYTRES